MNAELDRTIDTAVSHAPEMGCPPAGYIEPSEDEAFINQFPNLVPRPENPSVRIAYEDHFSILIGERIRFHSLMRHLARTVNRARPANARLSDDALRAIRWSALHGYYSRTYGLTEDSYERDAAWFATAMKDAQETIKFLIATYLPLRFHRQLEMDPSVAGEHDPIQLMRLCMSKGTDVMSRIRRFEARRQLTLAQLNFEMTLMHGTRQDLEARLTSFVAVCEEEFFVPGKSDQVTVIAELDPANAYRVSSFQVLPRSLATEKMTLRDTQIVLPLDVRFVANNGEPFPVYFDARAKEHPVLKLIAKRERRRVITDLLGVKFVFFNEEHDLMRGIELLRRNVVCIPGTVAGEASNARRAGVVDSTNRHSSDEYQATKYDVTFGGWPIELTFEFLPIFINELVSRGRDNHRLYKLSQYLDLVLPVTSPTALYGVDWRNPDLRQLLCNFQLHKL